MINIEADSGDLELATKDKVHINNRIGKFGHNQQRMTEFISLLDRHPTAIERSANTDMYNCHGLVFAARRTNISDTREVEKILKHDDYMVIEKESVVPGDIIVYYSDDKDAEHSGIVIEKGMKPLYIPIIISKWGILEEYIHQANDCEYKFANAKYYRMRI